MHGTGFGAVHAADTLAALGSLYGVDAHLAYFGAFAAINAFALIDIKSHE